MDDEGECKVPDAGDEETLVELTEVDADTFEFDIVTDTATYEFTVDKQ